MFVREGIELNKRLYGSSSQFSIKPGTFDLSLVASTAKCFIKFYNKTCEHKEDVKKKYYSAIPMGRGADPEEIAYLVRFLASGESDFITGQEIMINGGYIM